MLHAALARSLTRALASQARMGCPVPELRPELLRAARWIAARDGLSGCLLDPLTAELIPARSAVASLLRMLEADLADHGEFDEVWQLTEQVLGRGTSARRQRRILHRTGDLREVAGRAAAEGPAHLPWHPDLPVSGIRAGADLVLHSVHKSGAGLLQASVLHINGDLVDMDVVGQRMDLLATTSASTLVYASIDGWRRHMALDGEKDDRRVAGPGCRMPRAGGRHRWPRSSGHRCAVRRR